MNAHSSSPTIGDIVFHPLSANEWRVSDARYPKHSIEALLGFVAQKGSHYYATRMHHPLDVVPLGSLDEVAAVFVTELAREAGAVAEPV